LGLKSDHNTPHFVKLTALGLVDSTRNSRPDLENIIPARSRKRHPEPISNRLDGDQKKLGEKRIGASVFNSFCSARVNFKNLLRFGCKVFGQCSIRGRCYHHNFRRSSVNFRGKIGRIISENRQFFRRVFRRKCFENIILFLLTRRMQSTESYCTNQGVRLGEFLPIGRLLKWAVF
jgi:hypothetical protein